MMSFVKQLKRNTVQSVYQYLFLLVHMVYLSGSIAILFDALWSATLFLPLSVGVEILLKFVITHAIEHFVHHHG